MGRWVGQIAYGSRRNGVISTCGLLALSDRFGAESSATGESWFLKV